VGVAGRRIYNAMASTVDDACKNITDALKEAGMWNNSL
jgi:arylsulfatase A-like enzyme